MLYNLLNRSMKEKYNLTTLVETGTGERHGIVYALGLGFACIYSIEADAGLAAKADRAFRRQNVNIIHAQSVDALPTILPKLTGNVCWWLDGHSVENKCWPLLEELDIIRSRDLSKDVIIMDDQHRYGKKKTGINPDYSWLEPTHSLRLALRARIAEPFLRIAPLPPQEETR